MAGYFFISINAVTYNFHCNMHCVTVKIVCYTRSIIMLVRQRESWIKQWESGDVPTLAQLGVTVSDDLRQQWRDNWQSEVKAYIHYYNTDRIKAKLKGLSPVQYRTQSLVAA